jgi:hypothetical protein
MGNNNDEKVPYICGSLTELSLETREWVKPFYSQIADACEKIIGKRPFVPHEHYDPVKHPDFTPKEIDKAERKQICEKTSLLIVVAIAPSWGGGIEVEMANRSNVPIVILHHIDKTVSRLLLGNPSVVARIAYSSHKDALSMLKKEIAKRLLPKEN